MFTWEEIDACWDHTMFRKIIGHRNMLNDCKQIRTAGSKVQVIYQEKAKVIPEADGMKSLQIHVLKSER